MDENETSVTDQNSDRPLTKRERRELAREEKRQKEQKDLKSKKLKNYLIGFLVVIGLLFLGYKAWKWVKAPTGEGTETSQNNAFLVRDSDWMKGNREANLTLIEYGDFQCPACAIYSELVKKLSEDFPNNLRIVYRHFPLPSHKNAVPGAKAAEAAGRQGKFWEMHDLLYAKQEEWSTLGNPKDKFVEYAKSLDLDEEKFKSDFDSSEIEDKINADRSEGIRLRISGTPTFFLNDKKLPQIGGYDDFKKIIEESLTK